MGRPRTGTPVKFDAELGLTLYAPTPTNATFRLDYIDPFTKERKQPRRSLEADAFALWDETVEYLRTARLAAPESRRRGVGPTVDDLFEMLTTRWADDERSQRYIQTRVGHYLWAWMLEQFDRLSDTPTIALGDFNTETSYRSRRVARLHGADLMQSLTAELSWNDVAVATGQASPTYARNNGRTARLDYAFASPTLGTASLQFDAPTTVGTHHLVGEKACSPLSDHTPVVVDLERLPASVA